MMNATTMNTRVTETVTWDSTDVRRVCIKYNYYTRGDNDAYSRMLDRVDAIEPTTAGLYEIATDIARHSAVDYTDTDIVAGIMFDLSREAVHRFYDIFID